MAGAGSGAGSLMTALGECAQAFVCAILDYFSGPPKNTKIVEGVKFKRYNSDTSPGVIPVNNKMDKKFSYIKFVERVDDYSIDKSWKNTVFKEMVKTNKTLPNIETFLKKNRDWFVSSINIAESLNEKIKTRLRGWDFSTKDFYHYRGGGKNGLMDNIQQIFTLVNNENKNYFSNINRWCPADIYIGTSEGEKKVKNLLDKLKEKQENRTIEVKEKKTIEVEMPLGGGTQYPIDLTFHSINYIFRYLVQHGMILPISLKKTPNTFQVIPIKMFNGGPPMTAAKDKNKNFKSDDVKIEFDDNFIDFGSFYGSMDMYIKVSSKSVNKLGYNELKLQIRDKSSSSRNDIVFRNPNVRWKFGIQGVVKFVPSPSQSGGIGVGTLNRIVGLTNIDVRMNNAKEYVSGIASKFIWKDTGEFSISGKLSDNEKKFINEFVKLAPVTDIPKNNANSALYHCLNELHKQNAGTSKHPGVKDKLKKSKITPRNRYLVARWFLAKYYCMIFADKIKQETGKKNLKTIFKSALSLDKGIKGGGGSLFFVKAG